MKRAFCIIVMALLAFAALGSVSFAQTANPTTECGQEDPKYNKYQIGGDGSVGGLESNIGTVVTLTAKNAADRTYDYTNTKTEDWTLFRIVLKHGQTANIVVNDPPQSGTVDGASDLSHITFCFKAATAPEPTPTPTTTPDAEVEGSSTQMPRDTRVLGEQITRPQAQVQAQGQAIAATGPEDTWLALAAIGLILLGAMILQFVPRRIS